MDNVKKSKKFVGSEIVYTSDGVERVTPKFEFCLKNSNFTQKFWPKKGVYVLVPRHFSAADRQVLDYFEITMSERNIAMEPVTQIMERLQLAKPTVYNCITELRKHDFIRKKHNSCYMVNPNYASKSKADIRSELLDEYWQLSSDSEDNNP